MTRTRKRIVVVACVLIGSLYVIGLVWGNQCLAWGAIKNLGVTPATAITLDRDQTSVSRAQESYLWKHLRESPTPTTPRVHVNVHWNAFVCARVDAGQVGPLGTESRDRLFVCVFGAWVPIYTFGNPRA